MTARRYTDAQEISEDELALEFTEANPNHRWVDAWHKWFYWTGQVWREDSTLHVFDLVRQFIRNYSWVSDKPRDLRRATTIAAVEKLARSDRAYSAVTDQWDADPMLLNTPSGMVDLRTGQVHEHSAEKYCTKITGTELALGQCPRWLRFLDDICKKDAELIAFLRRVSGYCLSGDTREHALFFLHGFGGNGKSTFLNVLKGVMGDYATDAPMETFTASKGDRHPTELAKLNGARLVVATETEEGRRWAESRIKQLTGGDRVSARFMRQDFFEYVPQFKLVIAGNHKPRIQNVDVAMRRRLHLVPFEASFQGDKRVTDMEEQLKDEWAVILGWMVEGFLEWQNQGLNPPASVSEATEHYFTNQDMLSEWRAERCETGPGKWETPTRLFASWREFAKAAQHPVGERSSFNDRMEAAGFMQHRDREKGRHWQGISVVEEPLSSSREWVA